MHKERQMQTQLAFSRGQGGKSLYRLLLRRAAGVWKTSDVINVRRDVEPGQAAWLAARERSISGCQKKQLFCIKNKKLESLI